MCAGAIAHVRLRRVVYGAEDPKAGAVDHGVRFFASPSCNHRPEVVSGVSWQKSAELLKAFFAARR
jgi:tRNA(Arg) A34 adenosine deaminase TadA